MLHVLIAILHMKAKNRKSCTNHQNPKSKGFNSRLPSWDIMQLLKMITKKLRQCL